MEKALITLVLLALLLTACGSKTTVISVEEAQRIVLRDLGVSNAEMHTHAGSGDTPSYSIYVTVGEQSLEYIIDTVTGQILSVTESNHSH